MTIAEALSQLKLMRNEKMIAHNIKNGAGDNQYGAKLGDIRGLAKKIKTDQALAFELWKTGNIDARLLATLIIKPNALSAKELEDMAASIDFAQVADWFSANVLKEYPDKDQFREKWMSSSNKWLARLGWGLTTGKATRDAETLDLDKILDRIETEMPAAPPEVQWNMNMALGQIGINHAKHRKRTIAIGERLGMYRDYPVPKGCTSPFVPIWVNEMVSRQKNA
jgi:3-methyladenine DNA glycosylase AlkD